MINANYDFLNQVKEVLGGQSAILKRAKEIRTRGFDAQIELLKMSRGVNTIKVTTENDVLELVLYKIVPAKRQFTKVKTIQLTDLNTLNDVIQAELGFRF